MDKHRIHEMLEKFTEVALSEITTKGACNVDTREMGAVVDMIKDLAEAEKAVWEKCYYKEVVEAMKEADEFEEMVYKEGRAGYDRWRNSHGRFAPRGHGHETSMAMATGRHGFIPDPTRWPEYHDDSRMWNGESWIINPMGYSREHQQHSGSHDGRSMGPNDGRMAAASRMGYTGPEDSDHDHAYRKSPYDHYKEARRHYQESSTQENKRMMDEKAKECVSETIDTMKDIFVQADPQMQQKMKDDLFRLYREFGGK